MNQEISLLEWWSIAANKHYFLTAKTEWGLRTDKSINGVYQRFTEGEIDKYLDYILRAQLRGIYGTT